MRKILTVTLSLALFAVGPFPILQAKKATKASEESETKAPPEQSRSGNDGEKKKKNGDKPFEDVIEGFERIEGLFTLYRDDDEGKVYLEILPDQLDTVFLCGITREAGDGFYFDSGAMLGEFPFVFRRVGKKVHFVHKNVYFRADETAAVHGAVARNLSDSLMGAGKILSAPHPERGSLLVDPTSFFIQDVQLVSYIFKKFIKTTSYGFDGKNSYFGAIHSYPRNTEIDAVIHFKSGNPGTFPTLPDARSFQHTYRYSLSALPEDGYLPRIADDRVGHFMTMHQDFSTALRDTPYVRYVNRWRLEKAEPKFAVSKPRQPIVYWLENTVPVEYRDAVREGILLWNDAFEKIGFKNAIEVKQQPDDAEWDPADVRYSTVRWIIQPGAGYAVGPSRTNPYTGQIYDADIRVSADMVRSVFMAYEQLTKPVARGDEFASQLGVLRNPAEGACDFAEGAIEQAAFGWNLLSSRDREAGSEDLEQYVHDFLVHVIAHEVGHTLGLRHNFKASTVRDNGELQADSTAGVGLTGSLMDYTPVNIAPPGQTQGAYWQTRLGAYDYWAIEYAYRPLGPDDDMSEKELLESIASRVAEPALRYGTDEDAMFGPRGLDPTATRWDLGADAVEFYETRVGLVGELWENLESEFEVDGERYQRMRQVFNRGMNQYRVAVANTAKYVGGMYHHRDHIGDPAGRPPFVPIPARRQREALSFLTEHVFGPRAFEFPPTLLDKLAPERFWDFSGSTFRQARLDYPLHQVVAGIQQGPLNHLYSGLLMQRLIDAELRTTLGADPLTLPELFVEVREAIWDEVTRGADVSSFRRSLQRAHLDKLITLVVAPRPDVPEDASTLARADLKRLQSAAERSLSRGGVDELTAAHLDETSARIEAALQAGLERRLPS